MGVSPTKGWCWGHCETTFKNLELEMLFLFSVTAQPSPPGPGSFVDVAEPDCVSSSVSELYGSLTTQSAILLGIYSVCLP